jgi:SAM-dependent methyltransferase
MLLDMSSELNRAWWDERVPLHAGSGFYDLQGFRDGADTLRPFEPEELGEVAGQTLVHLQCHIGLDTLSWARRGARVSGLDFSPPAIDIARTIASDIGVGADFVESDVYDAPRALGGRRFDVVYTGVGALNWLGDLDRWAAVVAELLAPGGRLYLLESHPIADMYGDDELVLEYDYFGRRMIGFEEPGSYADPDAVTEFNRTEQWIHPLGDIVSAILGVGLQVELLHEHDRVAWQRFPFLVEEVPGIWRWPDGMPRIPLMFSLRARRS